MAETILKDRPLPAVAPSVRKLVHDLAAKHGVTYAESGDDQLSNALARLSDNDVQLDETESLILALRRAGVISGDEGRKLHGAYIRGDLGLS